jgi:hypothetical protein
VQFFGVNGHLGARNVAISKTNLPGKEIGICTNNTTYSKKGPNGGL